MQDFKYWLRGYLFEKLKDDFNFDELVKEISEQADELLDDNNNVIINKLEILLKKYGIK